MNINNADQFLGSHWDWTFLNPVFHPTKIRVSDIDGVIERNGNFLYIETKSRNAKIPMGQRIMHQSWVNKGDSVLYIWGDPNQPERAEIVTPKAKKVYAPCTTKDIENIVRQWFEWANSQ